MQTRIVKPAFYPLLAASCVLLAIDILFLIGGMLSHRMEDYFIAAVAGFILFICAKTVMNNTIETPVMSIALLFIIPAIVIVYAFVMAFTLTDADGLNGNILEFLYYIGDMRTLRADGIPVTRNIQRQFFLSGGVIVSFTFVLVHTATVILLLFKTKPNITNAGVKITQKMQI